MSHRTVKVLRLTCESRGRKIVGTVKHGFGIVIIKDPAGRRIRPKIATLRVYPGAQFVSLKPHVRKVYLRQVNLQKGASYDVRHGMTISYRGHMWTVQFVDMIQRTRSHSQLRSARIAPVDDEDENIIKLPGLPYIEIFPSDGKPHNHDNIWLPARVTTRTNESQRQLFFQAYHSLDYLTATIAYSYLYSPRRDVLSAVLSLPTNVTILALVVENPPAVSILRNSIERLSTLEDIRSIIINYDFISNLSVHVPLERAPIGLLTSLTCLDVTDHFSFTFMRSFMQYNGGLNCINIGGTADFLGRLIQLCRSRQALKDLGLNLDQINDLVPLLNMVRFPQLHLNKLHITLSTIVDAMVDPRAIRQVLQSQSGNLEDLLITEDNLRPDHICHQHCPFNLVPPAMTSLNNVILSTLTCAASSLGGIMALEEFVNVILNIGPNDPFHLYNFVRVPQDDQPRPCHISTLAVSDGRVIEALVSPLVLQINPHLWGNLVTLDVNNIRLSDVHRCFQISFNLENLHLETVAPTVDDWTRITSYKDPIEDTIADYFLVGGAGPATLRDCICLKTLCLSISLPHPDTSDLPAVGASLFEGGLRRLAFLTSFKCNAVSSILNNIMTAYANALPDFICDLTLHDPVFPDP